MKVICSFVVLLATGCVARAQVSDPEPTDSLIKQLGSAKFNTRDQASKLLILRPDAETALRKALTVSDAETRRRIEAILDYYERRPLRELSDHLMSGRMDEIIRLVADWPEGKYEEELWLMMTGLVRKLNELHKKKGGTEFPNPAEEAMGLKLPPVVKAVRVTESTKGKMDQMYFVRAREIDIGYKGPFNNNFDKYGIPVVSDVASFGNDVPIIVFAGKRVVLPATRRVIVVSGGDVVISGYISGSLIIARGSVMQTPRGEGAGNCHIIAGKKVHLPGLNDDNLVVENEPIPLGYIRWSDAPKVEPKKK